MIIWRKTTLVNMVVPYTVLINNIKIKKIRNNQTIEIEVPNEQFVIRLSPYGNSLQFHKMDTERVVFPSYSKKDYPACEILTKPNLLGMITLGILQPVVTIHLNILY